VGSVTDPALLGAYLVVAVSVAFIFGVALGGNR